MAIERVYWDSVTFVHRIQQTPEHIDILRAISDEAERGKLEIVTSTFTLCEVACLWLGSHADDVQERMIRDFFENPYILLRQVDRRVAELSREIVRTLKIPGKDAVHVASAVATDCDELQTYDEKHLLRKTGLYGTPPLKIVKPNWPGGQANLGLHPSA